jgi:hypothetical protein
MTGGAEHWLDELAVRATRGSFLRSLALVAGGLAFPLARPRSGSAAANDPTACRKGCFFAAHKNALRAQDTCIAGLAHLGIGTAGFVGLWSNSFYGLALEGTAMIRYVSCRDHALLTEKAAQWDCMQPNCPGLPLRRLPGCGRALLPRPAGGRGLLVLHRRRRVLRPLRRRLRVRCHRVRRLTPEPPGQLPSGVISER